MTELQTKSWILLSTALASQSSPANFKEISGIADGINHAVPNHKELQDSLTWLIDKEIVLKKGTKYSLTNYGKELISDAESNSNILHKIWENLEKRLVKI